LEEQKIIQKWKGGYKNVQSNFKAFASSKGKKGLKSLNARAAVLHEEFFDHFDCLQCAGCCKGISPVLNSNDINRIAKSRKEDPKEFEQNLTIRDKEGDMGFKKTPCCFLGELNKCSIYQLRPKACREYPHTDAYNFESHWQLHLKNIAHCPGVWHVCKELTKA